MAHAISPFCKHLAKGRHARKTRRSPVAAILWGSWGSDLQFRALWGPRVHGPHF